MATVQIRGKCKTCGSPRLFQKQGLSNVLHLLLAVVTVGLWIPIWLLLGICNAFVPFRCTTCGEAKLR